MPPWLQLPGLVLLCGGEAAVAQVPGASSEGGGASFEVPASGNPRLIRAEQSQSQEDLQAGPVQEAALVWTNETNYEEDPYCGGPDYVSTCGFQTRAAIEFEGKEIRGLCVCPRTGGCTDPKCSLSMDGCRTTNGPFCSDGKSCIVAYSSGWQCWDPCDMAKQAVEYGSYSGMVARMRVTHCGSSSSQLHSAQAASPRRRHIVAPFPARASSQGSSTQSQLGGQPSSSSQWSNTHSQPGSVSSSSSVISSSAKTWFRDPPLNAGLYLAYNKNPFGGRTVVGHEDDEKKK